MLTVTKRNNKGKFTSMVSHNFLLVITLFAAASSVLSYDPDPLQDFCIAVTKPKVFLNGMICKDPKLVNSSDFVFKAKMNIAGNTSNTFGFALNAATVTQFPALNTLGISLARLDYAPNGGLNSPHLHPRASELIAVMEGTLLAGFVTSNPGSKLFSAVLKPGDLFIFPKGLIHFQYNIGQTPAVAFAALGSQNPGLIGIANAVFGSKPPIRHDLLEKAFQVNREVIDQLEAPFKS